MALASSLPAYAATDGVFIGALVLLNFRFKASNEKADVPLENMLLAADPGTKNSLVRLDLSGVDYKLRPPATPSHQ